MRKNEDRIETFEDALRLIFSNTIPRMVVVRKVEEENPEAVEEADERQEIFDMMTERELEAFDLLETFSLSPKAGLPEDDDSLEARIEHAEWNGDDLRDDVAGALAEFEASLAYYAAMKAFNPGDIDIQKIMLEDIQDRINDIVGIAREVELLHRLETAKFKADCASVDLDEALVEKEILQAQLDEYYEMSVGQL